MPTVALILATALCLCTLRPDVASAAAGDLDPSFGTGGVVTASVDNHLHFVGGVALLPDGRIVTAGSGVSRVMLTRHLANGTPDPSFGMSGIVTLDVGGGASSAADGLSVHADGTMLIVGGIGVFGGSDLFVARVLADGSLDPTFGTGGVARVSVGCGNEFVRGSPLELADGSVVVTGGATASSRQIFLARFDSAGALDPSFGTGGLVVLDLSPRDELLLSGPVRQPAGFLLAAGYTGDVTGYNEMTLLARFEPDGALDTGFGSTGFVTGPGPQGLATGVVLQADGRIVIGGRRDFDRFLLVRYLADGTLDTTFGESLGLTDKPVGDVSDLAPSPDGRFHLVGNVAGYGSPVLVARYTRDGVRDWTYATAGVVQVPNSSDILARAAVTQPDGRLVVAGELAIPAESFS